MVNIGYKTKGDNSPNGKPRVWFCAHKDDYVYLNDVCGDIFEYTNSAVYYDLNPDDDNVNDDLSVLSEMNLFVMPVTSNLLYTDNRAINSEFVFALEHNIPILPIMYEKGLDAQFYVKCGSLQYLDKTSEDKSAISYAEKFKKFVSKILLGDDMYDKVRKAFDAYIFLSYRKKDRAKAKELMSLIHSNDFCRDIAIWYDEFLTPGEDFNTSISQALEKSELFVMAVTSNVVNEENYVMKVEYPEAVKAGKKIIPARLEDVDEKDLKKKYDGIPDSFDAKNVKLLSDMLSSSLKDVALLVNDGDPEHNYFMGLAYLYGIDVEVNNEMAVKLIKKASNEGLIVAHEKLSDMYFNGEGIARNLQLAIEYKIKCIKAWYNKFHKKPTINYLDKFCEAMDELADYYTITKNYSKIEKIYDALVKELKCISCPSDETLIKRHLASAYHNQGKALKNLDDERCVKVLEETVTIYKEIVNESNNVQDKRKLSNAYSSLSWAYMHSFKEGDNSWDEYGNKNYGPLKTGKEFESLELAKKALKLDEDIANETGLIRDKRNIYYDYNNLHNSYLSLQDYVKERENALKLAKEYREKALEYALTFEGVSDSGAKRILSMGYVDLGDKYQNNKDYALAEEYYLKALYLRKERYEKSPTISNTDELRSAYYWLQGNALGQNDYKKALEYSLKQIELSKEVYAFAMSDDARKKLASDYSSCASIFLKLEDKEKAKEYLEKSYHLQNENINNIADSKEKAEKIYWNYNEKLSHYSNLKDYDGVIQVFDKLTDAFYVIIKLKKDLDFNFIINQGVMARSLASFLENRDYGDKEYRKEPFELSLIYHKKAVDIFKIGLTDKQMQNVSIAEFNLAREYELIAQSYHYLGDEENVIKSIDTAISYRDKSYEDWISCCKDEYKNACMEFEIVKTLVEFNWAYPREEGAKMYFRAREILSRITEKYPLEKKFSKKYQDVCKYIELYYSEYEEKI